MKIDQNVRDVLEALCTVICIGGVIGAAFSHGNGYFLLCASLALVGFYILDKIPDA